ncbi:MULTISPECIES: preprotein translocase subunit SecE [Mycobacterium]|uniref:Protein translocase subunit SecE n=1 Tax=Mycobacterium gordonae TaxID=1778 RepID=A0A1A6B751_MYCGO|nr:MULTISPECIES: preprotein translocase subunit SecE [Mycobacterium]MBI2700337.1 preprotein translocase subunit SecE [Mycobacterium sp.]MBX9983022.1 preprotein translocase subunit SecE [Mycobacterium gordonae]MCQ4360932.1 preprotein translocase subunit SecE [Mycobacterium gordonae]MCV7009596.1 preprotein translocase subunit SecE [Mycobacterium gordonae]OBR98110.1 preprotein translocase subunit SecE [Mycobacterium gordonae]
MSDEGDVADDAAGDGGAVVTKAAARPQRPTGKRSRVRAVEAEDGDESTDVEVAEKDSAKKDASKSSKTSKAKSTQKDKAKKPKKAGSSGSINPFVFVYNYLKQVVAEMRKVIWPNRKQMLTYTSVVLVFLAFMVALVGGADLGLSKLVLLVFG